MDATQAEVVSIPSGADRLVGHLFHAAGPAGGTPAPAVLVTGSWTTVKEQMADLYARKLAEAGLTALSFDFAGWGASEGSPREVESPSRKIEDIAAAARWLAGREGVTAVGGLAVCASAGYMAHAIAEGAPISALVTVAAWLHDAGTVGEMYGGAEGLAGRRRDGEAALQAFEATGEVRTVPAFSATDPKAGMGEAVAPYYGDPARGAVPEWPNRLAVMSWPEWLTFDGLARAGEVTVPTLMVHSEGAAFPDNLRRFADALAGPHEVIWREGQQIDFYDDPALVGPAVEAAVAHLGRSLAGQGA